MPLHNYYYNSTLTHKMYNISELNLPLKKTGTLSAQEMIKK